MNLKTINVMLEIWRTAIYKGISYDKYQVSNLGRVKSLNYLHHKSLTRILKPSKDKFGYLRVGLCKNGETKHCFVHRLVADTFLENPENKPEVNHIDEDKENNYVGTPENDYMDGNLEWCSREYNVNYGNRTKKATKANTNGKCSKKVLQFTLDGEFVREWPSTQECGRNGFGQGLIAACCRGEYTYAYGFLWRYK